MEPETKRSIRCDRAFWQRVSVGAIAVAAVGCIGLGGMYARQRSETARWMQEAQQAEQVKEAAVQAVGDLVDKVQGLEAQIATMTPANETSATTVSRYAPITDDEREMLARLVYLEAGAASFECQQACAETVLNRVSSEDFPDTVADVLHDTKYAVQFPTAAHLSEAEPGDEQYQAVDAAIYGPNMTPMDVVFFSTRRENDNIWGVYDGVVFCYGYDWDVE